MKVCDFSSLTVARSCASIKKLQVKFMVSSCQFKKTSCHCLDIMRLKRQHCSSPCYDAMMVKNIIAGWEAKSMADDIGHFYFTSHPVPALSYPPFPTPHMPRSRSFLRRLNSLNCMWGWGLACPHPSIKWSSAKSMGDNLANPKMKRQHCSSPCYDAMMVKNITAGWEANVWLITLRKQQL